MINSQQKQLHEQQRLIEQLQLTQQQQLLTEKLQQQVKQRKVLEGQFERSNRQDRVLDKVCIDLTFCRNIIEGEMCVWIPRSLHS